MSTMIDKVEFKIFDDAQLKTFCEKIIEVGPVEFSHIARLSYKDILDYWSNMLKRENFIGLNAYVSDELIGVINGVLIKHPYNNELLIGKELQWWVAEKHRNSSVGMLLLDEFEKTLKLNGANGLIMTLLHKDVELTRRLNLFYLRKNYKVFETYYIKEI